MYEAKAIIPGVSMLAQAPGVHLKIQRPLLNMIYMVLIKGNTKRKCCFVEHETSVCSTHEGITDLTERPGDVFISATLYPCRNNESRSFHYKLLGALWKQNTSNTLEDLNICILLLSPLKNLTVLGRSFNRRH